MLVKYIIWGIVFFLQLGNSLYSQSQTISGQVVDASNGQPVEFANLGIKDTHMGDATDENGNFELSISKSVLDKTVSISAVGYQTREIAISRMLEDPKTVIRLIPVVYGIEQVDVTAPSRILYGMLKMIVRQIPNNYIATPYSADIIYKEVNGTRKRTLNLAYTDATGYSSRTFSGAFEYRNYRITGGERNFEYPPFSEGMMPVEELLAFDYARTPGNVLDTTFQDHFRVFQKEKYLHQGQHVLVIGFECTNPRFAYTGDAQILEMSGEIHIVQNDMHMLRSIAHYKSQGWSRHGRSFMVDEELQNKNTGNITYSIQTDYERHDNKLYLERVQVDMQKHLKSSDEPELSSYELLFENIKTGEKVVDDFTREYYDKVSIYSDSQ